jgi:hypothetical protein
LVWGLLAPTRATMWRALLDASGSMKSEATGTGWREVVMSVMSAAGGCGEVPTPRGSRDHRPRLCV